MDAGLQEHFDWLLTASLDEVVASDKAASVDVPAAVSRWEVPADAREALRRWGLPVMSRNPKSVSFKPDVQDSRYPELAWNDGSAYRLGSYHYRDVGVAEGSGVVIGIPQDRPHAYSFVWLNGNVAAFIDIAWRWTLARPILMQLEEKGEGEQLVSCLYRFPDYARSADPLVAEDVRFRWWNEIADNW